MIWGLRWLFERKGRYDVYHPSEQLLYRYWNGYKWIYSDPMILWKRLMEKGPELSIDIKLANSIHKDAPKGHKGMIEKMQWIFQVKPYDPETRKGLTELKVVELFDHFMVFCDTLKKKSNPSPISSGETSAPSAPTSAASQPTESSSPSGSTGNEPKTDRPESPPSPSPLPEDSPLQTSRSSATMPMEREKPSSSVPNS